MIYTPKFEDIFSPVFEVFLSSQAAFSFKTKAVCA